MTHVPYRGAAPAILDILAGRTDFLFISLGDVTRQIRGGELRLLALGDDSGRAVTRRTSHFVPSKRSMFVTG